MPAEPAAGNGSGSEPTGLKPSRVEALGDGLFAIAMTLLVFQIKVPALPPGASRAAFAQALIDIWPQVACFVMSFITTGTLWVAHHAQFHHIRRTDRPLLWINIVFLMLVSTIPFTTAVLGQYPLYPLAVMVYGVNLVLAGLALWFHWRYATTKRRLTSQQLSQTVVEMQSWRILAGLVVYAAAIAVAPLAPLAGVVCYALVPLLYALPGRVDRHWHR